jgi:glycosyltransferase involved in cell wall biosynthesis
MRFSIIINNFNYGRFVGQAIESALAVDWWNKETIVVDDGSSDNSRATIEAFGDRIIPIFTANGGQAKAANAGFGRSTGDVVIFLDADDLLLPSVAQQVAAAWHQRIAKVQYGMIFVDQALQPLGVQWPIYTERQTAELVSRSMRQTGDYRSSPTSGNAWSRDFLEEVFPLPTRDHGLHWIDKYLNKLAPFFGDVVSLTSPQCLYRRHADNDSTFAGTQQYLDKYSAIIREIDTVLKLANELLRQKGRNELICCKNEYYIKLVFISKRFFPDRYPDRLVTLLLKYWGGVFDCELYSPKEKALLFVWGLVVVVMPRRIARMAVVSRERHAVADAKSLRRLLGRAMVSG